MSAANQSALSPRQRLCLVTAADIEFNNIARALPYSLIGRELGLRICRANLSEQQSKRPIVLLQSEMGAPDFAVRLRNHLSVFSCDGLIIIGLAGGLSPDLKTGDIVIYEHCQAPFDPQTVAKKPTARDEIVSIASDNKVVGLLEHAFSAARLPYKRGTGAFTRSVLTQSAEKTALHLATGANVVDMESWQVINALRDVNIPVAACRVIVDEAGENLPEFNVGLRADGTYDALKMLRVMLSRPATSVRFLWSLWRATRRLRQLAHALSEN